MKKLFLITTLISQFVFARASEPAKLDGAYLMKLKIGDRIFEDQLTIKAENEEAVISVNSYNGSIAGELIVPGMFTCVKPHFSGQATLEDGSVLGTFLAEQVSQ